jgi:hypothetical protein
MMRTSRTAQELIDLSYSLGGRTSHAIEPRHRVGMGEFGGYLYEASYANQVHSTHVEYTGCGWSVRVHLREGAPHND